MLNKGIEATLLSKEEIGKSKVLQKVGAGCGEPYWTRTPSYFSSDSIATEFSVLASGELSGWYDVAYGYGVRPVLKSDNLNELIKDCKSYMDNGIQVIEYGKFPHMSEFIEIDDTSVLPKTGKEYILPTILTTSLVGFKEYDYKGQKVVKAEYLYYPVKPVKWYFDEENNMLIAQDVLFFSPINNIDNPNYNGSFETSELYSYLNNDFLRQLLASAEILNRDNTDEIDDLSSLEAKVRELRSQNESKREKINRLEALLKEQEKLQRESAELDAKIVELTQKLNQKVKK